ncbi:MAG: hypothetical protein D6702_07165 [Planctomycetota bacterium]|nr:MAG: hypothetical protein D6702_07165 [Planctomycetota bacterium]
MSWSAAPSHRLKYKSKSRSSSASTSAGAACLLLRVATSHSCSGRNGRGSQGQSSAGKGSASRSWLVSRQIRTRGAYPGGMAPRPSSLVLELFARERCSAILRTRHGGSVRPAMAAAAAGGFRIVEFTLNTPGALDQIAEFSRRPGLLVGAGTVLDLEQAEQAVAAGAEFLVSPVADPDLIAWCRERDLLCVPGAFTPAEMLAAHRAGARILKLFPAPAGGPEWVRAVLGPLPFLRIFPTSGVDEENAADFLRAGAFGVGFVNVLFRPDDLAAGRFDAVQARAARLVAAVRRATDKVAADR